MLGLAVLADSAFAQFAPPPPPTAASTNQVSSGELLAREAARIRESCINSRRRICGPVVQITPHGLVVDSGYTSLLRPELSRSWIARSNVNVTGPPQRIEENKPDAACVGLVFIADIPKKPVVKLYDYVILQGYPDGQYDYTELGTIHKTIRRFSTNLEKAVAWNFQEKKP